MSWLPEEIEICREIAKITRDLHTYTQDWFYDDESKRVWNVHKEANLEHGGSFALLTIEDVLGELERRTRWLELGWAKDDDGTWELNVGAHAWGREVSFYADTPRLVCLKALLDVLKEAVAK